MSSPFQGRELVITSIPELDSAGGFALCAFLALVLEAVYEMQREVVAPVEEEQAMRLQPLWWSGRHSLCSNGILLHLMNNVC